MCASHWHGSVWMEVLTETRLWSTPAPAGSLLLWKEAGIGSLAQSGSLSCLFLPAQQVLLEWACSVSTPAVQSDCTGFLFSHSLETAIPNLPMCYTLGSHSLELGWPQCPEALSWDLPSLHVVQSRVNIGFCKAGCEVWGRRICVAGGDNISNWSLSVNIITC